MNFKRHLCISTCLALLSTTTLLADYSQEISDASMYPFIRPDFPKSSIDSPLHHYTVIGEMLYLKPYLGGLPWTYEGNLSGLSVGPSPTDQQSISEKIQNINLDFDFGFRLGVGFNTTWMKMENQLTWMRLHTQTSQTLPQGIFTSNADLAGSPLIYIPYWVNRAAINEAGQSNVALLNVQESTNFKWDLIDAVSKIPLSALKRATFSPLFGLRGLIYQMNSNLLQNSNAYGDTITLTPPFNTYIIKLKQRFNAVGLIGGLDSDVNFGYGLHLSALFDAALVYGNSKASNRFISNVPLDLPVVFPQNIIMRVQNYKFKPMFDFQVTLSWNINTANDRLGLNVHLGYELHYMPNFIEYKAQTRIDLNKRNLMLQGLNTGLGISF